MALQAEISIWWAKRFGGKFELQICHIPKLLLIDEFLAGAIFCKLCLLTLFRAPLWQLCHHFQPEHVEIWYFWNFWEVMCEIWISRQTYLPTRLKSQLGGPSKILYLLMIGPPHIQSKVLIMFLREFCIRWAIKPTFANSNHFWPFPRAPE